MAQQIAPPFGYHEVVPLLKTHKLRLPAAGEVPEFLRAANAVPISLTEFQLVAREYAIVFTTGDEGKSFAAVAVLGIGAGENLFLADGWPSASNIGSPASSSERFSTQISRSCCSTWFSVTRAMQNG